MTQTSDNKWHLDKRVNISIILVLGLQLVVFTSFLVGMDYRLNALEERAGEQHSLPTDIAVLKTEISGIKDDVSDNAEQLDRIENKIDRLREPN